MVVRATLDNFDGFPPQGVYILERVSSDAQHNAHMTVVLKPDLKSVAEEEVMAQIRGALGRAGLRDEDFFSYCQHSYGIEREGLTVHFGWEPNVSPPPKLTGLAGKVDA